MSGNRISRRRALQGIVAVAGSVLAPAIVRAQSGTLQLGVLTPLTGAGGFDGPRMALMVIDRQALGSWALTAGATVTFALILLPLVFVSWLAFFQQPIPAFPPQGYSLKWFFTIPENPKFVDGFWLSLQVAVIAMQLSLKPETPGIFR